jgi:FHS family glucose/mannose:H+ symporter-like MFS transporter
VKARLAIIYAGFALTGVATTMLGPILPYLSVRWALTDSQAGRLFTAQFVSSVSGCVIASWVVGRWGAAVTVRIGMFLIALGVMCLGMGGLFAGVAGIAVYGLGLGFALPSTNLWVSEMTSDQSSSALNLLNFAWTVGAVFTPMLLAALLKPVGLRGAMWLVSALLLVLALVETLGTHHRAGDVAARNRIEGREDRQDARLSLAILVTLFLFLYVGTENGFAGWLPSFARRDYNMSMTSTAAVQSCFWTAILLGRLFAPVFLKRVYSDILVKIGLMTALIGTLVSIASRNPVVLYAGVILSGLGLSTLFPTVAAIFTRWYGTKGAGSIVLGLGGLGGASIPWLVGIVTLRFGSLRLGFSLIFITILFAGAVFWRIQRLVQTQFAPTMEPK